MIGLHIEGADWSVKMIRHTLKQIVWLADCQVGSRRAKKAILIRKLATDRLKDLMLGLNRLTVSFVSARY